MTENEKMICHGVLSERNINKFIPDLESHVMSEGNLFGNISKLGSLLKGFESIMRDVGGQNLGEDKGHSLLCNSISSPKELEMCLILIVGSQEPWPSSGDILENALETLLNT